MRLTTLTLALFPMAAFAVSTETDTPPTPSETTTVCEEGQSGIWRPKPAWTPPIAPTMTVHG